MNPSFVPSNPRYSANERVQWLMLGHKVPDSCSNIADCQSWMERLILIHIRQVAVA